VLRFIHVLANFSSRLVQRWGRQILHSMRDDASVPSWLASLLIHALFLLVLALVSLREVGEKKGAVSIVFDSTATEEVSLESAFSEAALDALASPSTNAGEKPSLDQIAEFSSESVQGPHIAGIEFSSLSDSLAVAAAHAPLLPSAEVLNQTITAASSRGVPHARTSPAEGVSAAKGAEGAANGIIGHLRKDLDEGPIFIIWLLDASISLQADRTRLASTLQPFYADFERQGKEQPQLLSGVVAYGQSVNQVQDTTAFHKKSLTAIEKIPFDQSGKENVMAAVRHVLSRYGTRAKGRLRIVIWTDESGDDTANLEPVIQACRQSRTKVHVVGPSSVMGTDRGLQPYTDSATGYSFLLPVTRGPDTCFQERLLLPYWFDASANAGVFNGFMVADGLPWYGGALRERLMSGVGPYALTRLALETGGTFTILDRAGETAYFDLNVMKDYLPDYGNAAEIMAQVKASPFRTAIMRAVEATYRPTNLAPPRMIFPTLRSEFYPFEELSYYMTAAEFRSYLAAAFAQECSLVQKSAGFIEGALRQFGDDDWESSYENESSPRWRAWYDLTRGRLLMMSIRHKEYLATCKWLISPGNLASATNMVSFVPGNQSLNDQQDVANRHELASHLLARCVQKNPGTPWAMLAEWELETALGVAPIQDVIPPPQPVPVVAGPAVLPASPPVIHLPRL